MDEILFIDKPKGISSFSVIRELRRKLRIRKIGHAGTLDPIASGLLIIGVGIGTKRLKDYFGLPKTYVMDVLLGERRDTGDVEGKVLEEKTVGDISEDKVRKALEELTGVIEFKVPDFSAVKHKGRPLYKYARQGIKLEPKFRKTEIFYLKLFNISREDSKVILKIEMNCQKGTYARSVAEEIGKKLSLPATIKELRRIKAGDIDISRAIKLEDI